MHVRLATRIVLAACLILMCAVLVAGLPVSASTASAGHSSVDDRQTQQDRNYIRATAPEADDPSFWVYLPLVMQRFVPGIHGQVTYRGEAVGDVALHLWLCDSSSCSEADTTTTTAGGVYAFVGAPSLEAGQKYYVRFGPNIAPAGDARYLSNWYGPDIPSYRAGDSVAGGDFDIAGFALLLPCPGAKVFLPATLSWQPRQLGPETYRLLLSDPVTGEILWESADLGDVGSFDFGALPPGLVRDQAYDWHVNVHSASNGFGSSFARQQITFAPAVQSGIYGRVTYNCAAAGGIVLKLYFHDGAAWSPDPSTTTTTVDGIYVFPSPPSLAAGQKYRLGFGPNQDSTGGNPSYVYRWYGPDITSYTAGTAVAGGSNDIANVQLLSPPAEATVPLPALFEWQRRSLGPESYQWVLFNPSPPNTVWRTPILGDVSSYLLDGLPTGFMPGRRYGWYVNAYSSADGYVTSYYVRAIVFSGGAASQASGSLVPGGPDVYEDLTGSAPSWEK